METWEKVSEKQPVASRILMNSLQKNRISHAYLLTGGRGTGKKSLATLFAKTLFCPNKTGIDPCEACNVCKRILLIITQTCIGLNQKGNPLKSNRFANSNQNLRIQVLNLNRKYIY